jgi:beta-alanine--pyruvate transaminase
VPGKRAYDIFMDCFHHGVWVRPAGENIVICPPYIVEDAHIDQIVQTVADSIRRHA